MGDGPFRDDREADQARIAALEAELARAKDRVAELENRRSQALVLAHPSPPTRAQKLAGAPLRLELERTFDGELPAAKFEDVLVIIRRLTGDRGTVEILRSSITWFGTPRQNRGTTTSIAVTVENGQTRVAATDKLGQLATQYFGGLVAGTSSIPLVAPFAFGAWFGPLGILAGLGVSAAFVATTFTGARTLFKRGARKRAEKQQSVFDALAAEIEAMISSLPRPT